MTREQPQPISTIWLGHNAARRPAHLGPTHVLLILIAPVRIWHRFNVARQASGS